MFLGAKHPSTKIVAKSVSIAANDRGVELFDKKKYAEALLYFQKGLKNAEQAEDLSSVASCRANIAETKKRLSTKPKN
jgi:hypothetical protein